MKKSFFLFGLASLLMNAVFAQSTVRLSEAVKTAIAEIEAKIPRDTNVAVYDFKFQSSRIPKLIRDELISALVKSDKLKIVARDNLDIILKEIQFQESCEVSMQSAVIYGQKLGAQSIVYGEIVDMGSFYRITINTVDVTTAIHQVSTQKNVKDKLLEPPQQGISPLVYGFMNIGFGLGSYFQRDFFGGAIVTVGYASSIYLIAYELYGLKREDPMAGIPGTVGIGLACLTTAFGFIKPYFYNKNHRIVSVMDRVNIVPVSSEQGKSAFRIIYTYNF